MGSDVSNKFSLSTSSNELDDGLCIDATTYTRTSPFSCLVVVCHFEIQHCVSCGDRSMVTVLVEYHNDRNSTCVCRRDFLHDPLSLSLSANFIVYDQSWCTQSMVSDHTSRPNMNLSIYHFVWRSLSRRQWWRFTSLRMMCFLSSTPSGFHATRITQTNTRTPSHTYIPIWKGVHYGQRIVSTISDVFHLIAVASLSHTICIIRLYIITYHVSLRSIYAIVLVAPLLKNVMWWWMMWRWCVATRWRQTASHIQQIWHRFFCRRRQQQKEHTTSSPSSQKATTQQTSTNDDNYHHLNNKNSNNNNKTTFSTTLRYRKELKRDFTRTRRSRNISHNNNITSTWSWWRAGWCCSSQGVHSISLPWHYSWWQCPYLLHQMLLYSNQGHC